MTYDIYYQFYSWVESLSRQPIAQYRKLLLEYATALTIGRHVR